METAISKDGTLIAYETRGSGPTIILVDGAMCNTDIGPMRDLQQLLATSFRVIIYDRRGRGKSGENDSYSVDKEVQDIAALISAAGTNVALFGMSSGAILSLMSAARIQEITKVAIYDPPFNSMGNANAFAVHRNTLKELIQSGDRSGALKYFMKNIIRMPSIIIGIMQLLPVWKKLKANANSLLHDLDITSSFTLEKISETEIPTPALVLYGEKSPAIVRDGALEVSKKLKTSSVAMLKGQNHNVSLNVLAPHLIRFF